MTIIKFFVFFYEFFFKIPSLIEIKNILEQSKDLIKELKLFIDEAKPYLKDLKGGKIHYFFN